jgi:hypothetical protein
MRRFAVFFAAALCLAQSSHILYSPGCAIQTSPAPFVCHPVPDVSINGTVTLTDRLYKHDVTVQARYLARWAQPITDGIPVIEIGDPAGLDANNRFHLTIPDLSEGHNDAEIQLWARDKKTGEVVAQLSLVAPADLRTRMGGLKLQSRYPAEMVFAPCASNPVERVLHDRTGFAQRPASYDACPRD